MYFHFLQCALSDFFIFASKFVLYLRTQFTIFSSLKIPTKEIGALYKRNIKSHIFIFDSAPCQISLSLHHILFLDTHKVKKNFAFSKGTFQRKKVHFQK